MNPTLVKAIVESAAFLSLSGEEVIDPDAAVVQLEQLSSILKELSPADRSAFVKHVKHLAEEEERVSGKQERVVFLRGLAEHLGLAN